MKRIVMTISFVIGMGAGNIVASNACANVAASATLSDLNPEEVKSRAAANDHRLASKATAHKISTQPLTDIELQELYRYMPRELTGIIKSYIKGSFVIKNKQPQDKNGLITVKFMKTSRSIEPGASIDFFARLNLEQLIGKLGMHTDELGDVRCKITYYDPEARRLRAQTFAIRGRDSLRILEIIITRSSGSVLGAAQVTIQTDGLE